MTLAEFRLVLTEKSVNRKQLPATQELSERIVSGIKFIKLKGYTVLRHAEYIEDWDINTISITKRIEDHLGFRTAKRPAVEESLLDIDDELVDGLALWVMAGLERQNAKTFHGMAMEQFDANEQRLIDTDNVVSQDESEYNQAWV